MDLTLPQRVYLLSYELDKNRFDQLSTPYRGQLLRAAALTDLMLAGLVTDQDGKVIRSEGDPPSDPFLAEVLQDVPADKPRGRLGLFYPRLMKADAAVRTPLTEAGVLTAEKKKLLGLIPIHKITITHPERLRTLREQTRNAALTGDAPIADKAAALITIAGDVTTVFTLKEQKHYKPQIKALQDACETRIPGIHKAIRQAVAASRTASTS